MQRVRLLQKSGDGGLLYGNSGWIDEARNRISAAKRAGLAFQTYCRPVVGLRHINYGHFQGYLIALPVGVIDADFAL